MNKNLSNNSKMAEYFLIFGQMIFNIRFDIRFEVEYFNLEPTRELFIHGKAMVPYVQ